MTTHDHVISVYGARDRQSDVTFKLWANISRKGGGESEKSDSEFPNRKVLFTVRYDSRVNPECTISWNGFDYEIDQVEESEYDRQRYMKIHGHAKGLQR